MSDTPPDNVELLADPMIDPTTQSVDALVSSLVVEDGWPDPAILREIVARGQASVAPLIALIERTTATELAAYQGVELLTIIGDPSALPAIAHVYRYSDDDTAESFGMSLPAFGAAALPHFLPLVGDRSLTWYQRAVAADIALDIAGNDPGLRRQVSEAFSVVLADYVAEVQNFAALDEDSPERANIQEIVGTLIVDLAAAGAEDSRPLMRAAFDAHMVDESMTDDEILNEPFSTDRVPFVRNDWLAWYEKEYEHRNDPPPVFPKFAPEVSAKSEVVNAALSRQPYIAPLKPGRNEPCWCGSGKKYKKCHLGRPDDRFAP
jgi:hypothetical protein